MEEEGMESVPQRGPGKTRGDLGRSHAKTVSHGLRILRRKRGRKLLSKE